ncbi:MAG: type II toxin-antitoxin system HicB family antitoxin [Xenococcus sp. MO_188.B8]|nr:type II toxin-antitoxin system HicB family antitoxin [Xenococcus sp. MO_188.B8]
MKQAFTARVFQEDNWFVAQCLEVDIASQGKTKSEALSHLQEALELYFENSFLSPSKLSNCRLG